MKEEKSVMERESPGEDRKDGIQRQADHTETRSALERKVLFPYK